MNLNEINIQNKKFNLQNQNISDLCWKLFELSGEIRYYNLYRAFENENYLYQFSNESKNLEY